MIRLFIIALASILFINTNAQHFSANEVQQMLNNKRFTFEAQTVSPQSGASRQLTTEYFLKIAGDTLTSALPYFGRAYTAPVNPSEAGLDFTSTRFAYTLSKEKKNKYAVLITTKDLTDNTMCSFVIFDNGNASLQVTSNNKQPISFQGYIKQNK